MSCGGGVGGEGQGLISKLHFFAVGGGFRFEVFGGGVMGIEKESRFLHGRVYNAINDYSPLLHCIPFYPRKALAPIIGLIGSVFWP